MVEPYGLARWPAFGTFGVALPLLFTVGVVFEAVWSLGEELGWRVPVSPTAAAVRLPRCLPDLRVDLGRVALSGTPLDRLQAGHKAHLLSRLLHDHGDRERVPHGLP
jgi:hypothetical protein